MENGNALKDKRTEKWESATIASAILLSLLLAISCTETAFAATTGPKMGDASTYGLSISLTSQIPDPASAGEPVEIKLSLKNTGGKSIDNLTVELVPSYPFSRLESEGLIAQIGTLQGYQGSLSADDSQIIKYKVLVSKDAVSGTYPVTVRYSNSIMSGEADFDIAVSNSAGVDVESIDKTILVPGNETDLTFTIKNVGSSSLQNLAFSWENSDGVVLPVGGDNTKHVSFLDVGSEANISYKVVADSGASAGLYKLNLSVSYVDASSGARMRSSTIAGIYIGGGTDFDISLSEAAATSTSFSIANIGSNPAYSVTVKIPAQIGWTVSGSSSSTVGNLNTGDYTVTSFVLSSSSYVSAGNFSGNSSQQFPQRRAFPAEMNSTGGNFSASQTPAGTIRVEIYYTDTMGARKVIEKTVQMAASVSSATAGAATAARGTATFGAQRQQTSVFVRYGGYFAGAAAAIVAIAAGLVYRAKKKEDPDLTVAKAIRGIFSKRAKAQGKSASEKR